MILLKVTLKDGKPNYDGREIVLNTIQTIILKGKGEGSYVLMRKEHLKFKDENDRENNQQNPTCSLRT